MSSCALPTHNGVVGMAYHPQEVHMHAIPRWLHMPISPYVAHGPGDMYPPDMWCIVAIWGQTSGDVVTPG